MQKNFTITHIGDTELSLPMPFIYIPAKGKTFMFQADEKTGFKGIPVILEEDFFLCAYVSTQELWEVVIKESGITELNTNPSEFKGKHRPIVQISWNDIQIFNKAFDLLNENFKLTFEKDNIPKGNFGLPSEIQWEYSALSGRNYIFSGSQNLNDVAWFTENSNGKIMPVGLKEPNDFGFYDMSGNVCEWCSDSLDPALFMLHSDINRDNINFDFKWLRGGGATIRPNGNSLKFRIRGQVNKEFYQSGFRLRFTPE
jgi:formylglycine-generating enzyme required for sulfatase activity